MTRVLFYRKMAQMKGYLSKLHDRTESTNSTSSMFEILTSTFWESHSGVQIIKLTPGQHQFIGINRLWCISKRWIMYEKISLIISHYQNDVSRVGLPVRKFVGTDKHKGDNADETMFPVTASSQSRPTCSILPRVGEVKITSTRQCK